jgi:hypothetical protein
VTTNPRARSNVCSNKQPKHAVPSSPIFVTLMMKVIYSSETSVLTRAIRRNIPDDGILRPMLFQNCMYTAMFRRNLLQTRRFGVVTWYADCLNGNIFALLNFRTVKMFEANGGARCSAFPLDGVRKHAVAQWSRRYAATRHIAASWLNEVIVLYQFT